MPRIYKCSNLYDGQYVTHGDKLLSSTGGSKPQVFSTRHPTGRWVDGFRVPFPGGAICQNSIGKLAEWKVGSPGGGRLIGRMSWVTSRQNDGILYKKERDVRQVLLLNECFFFLDTSCLLILLICCHIAIILLE